MEQSSPHACSTTAGPTHQRLLHRVNSPETTRLSWTRCSILRALQTALELWGQSAGRGGSSGGRLWVWGHLPEVCRAGLGALLLQSDGFPPGQGEKVSRLPGSGGAGQGEKVSRLPGSGGTGRGDYLLVMASSAGAALPRSMSSSSS